MILDRESDDRPSEWMRKKHAVSFSEQRAESGTHAASLCRPRSASKTASPRWREELEQGMRKKGTKSESSSREACSSIGRCIEFHIYYDGHETRGNDVVKLQRRRQVQRNIGRVYMDFVNG
jgi:hypothetical protein